MLVCLTEAVDIDEGVRQLGRKIGLGEEDASPYVVDPRDPYTVSLFFSGMSDELSL